MHENNENKVRTMRSLNDQNTHTMFFRLLVFHPAGSTNSSILCRIAARESRDPTARGQDGEKALEKSFRMMVLDGMLVQAFFSHNTANTGKNLV